ncbi:Uncharacterized protein Fot_01012 [Forsythia ovata]|uniref:Uncharacterized protein n=1 Tax=Forsythia ovata TaxID=205694 RepID=A0ABD1X2S8_9LAMI
MTLFQLSANITMDISPTTLTNGYGFGDYHRQICSFTLPRKKIICGAYYKKSAASRRIFPWLMPTNLLPKVINDGKFLPMDKNRVGDAKNPQLKVGAFLLVVKGILSLQEDIEKLIATQTNPKYRSEEKIVKERFKSHEKHSSKMSKKMNHRQNEFIKVLHRVVHL